MDFIHLDDQERVGRDLVRSIETGQEFPTEFRIIDSDGRVHWLEDHGKLLRDSSGSVTAMVGVLRDITNRKNAQELLRASEERFRHITDQSFNAIFEIDPEGRFTYLSPSTEKISGYKLEELLQRHYIDIIYEEDVAELAKVFQDILNGRHVEDLHVRTNKKDGSLVFIEINALPVVENGKVASVRGVFKDVTAHKRMEEQIRQMQKMEAVGTLARGIAHDFNNILMGILGHAQILKSTSFHGEEAFETASVIEMAVGDAANLVKQLLGFSRKSTGNKTSVDAHRIVNDTLILMKKTIGPGIDIVQKLDAPLQMIVADASQLQQVLVNLVLNARDAMAGGGGTLTIASCDTLLDEYYCRTNPDSSPGPYMVLAVSDTGTGIEERNINRIFEPYFTSKEEGNGMGLAMVYSIIKNHGGMIRVYSKLGHGSRFEVYLPLSGEMKLDR
jgi:PAS domain S-box-containing protein